MATAIKNATINIVVMMNKFLELNNVAAIVTFTAPGNHRQQDNRRLLQMMI